MNYFTIAALLVVTLACSVSTVSNEFEKEYQELLTLEEEFNNALENEAARQQLSLPEEEARGFGVFATLAKRGIKLFAKLFKKVAPKIAKSLADRQALDQPQSALEEELYNIYDNEVARQELMIDEFVNTLPSEEARGFRVFATLAKRGLKLFAKLFKKAAPKIAKSLADREALDNPQAALEEELDSGIPSQLLMNALESMMSEQLPAEEARGFRVFATLAKRGIKLLAKLFKKAAPKIVKSLADRQALDQPASA